MRQLDIAKIEATRLDLGIDKTKWCKINRIFIRTYNEIMENPGKAVKDETIRKIAKGLDLKPSEIVIIGNHP